MNDTPKVGADRTGLLERYHEAVGLPAIEKSEAAPVTADANLDAATPASQSEVPPVVEHSEAAPVEPAAEVVAPDPSVKKEETLEGAKTVPLTALHEEREKRKAKTLEARKLQEQLGAKDQELLDLKARLASVEDTIRKAKAGEALDPEPDEVTKQLAEENKRLKEAQAKADQEKQVAAKAQAQDNFNKLVAEVDTKLTGGGFPGFKQFGKDVYDNIVARINAGEMEAKDVTTDLWMKVYKEDVYPAKKAIFQAQTEQEKKAAKIAAKKAANLTTNPGEGPTPKEDDNLDAPQTAESYLKMRKRIF